MIKDLFQILIKTLIFLLIAFVFAVILGEGLDRQNVVDCMKLKSQSTIEGFYLTETEAKMCDNVGIEIHAPIHTQEYAR